MVLSTRSAVKSQFADEWHPLVERGGPDTILTAEDGGLSCRLALRGSISHGLVIFLDVTLLELLCIEVGFRLLAVDVIDIALVRVLLYAQPWRS